MRSLTPTFGSKLNYQQPELIFKSNLYANGKWACNKTKKMKIFYTVLMSTEQRIFTLSEMKQPPC
jgi:hypothetical protein